MSNITVERGSWNGDEVKIRGRRAMDKSLYEIGLIVEAQAKALSPRKTGRLAGSITTQAPDRGTSPEAPARAGDVISRPPSGDVHVGTNVEYGPYQEYGTVRSSAQPFLRPALELARGGALTIVHENGRREFAEYMR